MACFKNHSESWAVEKDINIYYPQCWPVVSMLCHCNNVITEVSPVPSWLLSRCESQSVSPCGVTTPFSGRPSGLCGVTTLLSPSHGLLATLLIERSQGSQGSQEEESGRILN